MTYATALTVADLTGEGPAADAIRQLPGEAQVFAAARLKDVHEMYSEGWEPEYLRGAFGHMHVVPRLHWMAHVPSERVGQRTEMLGDRLGPVGECIEEAREVAGCLYAVRLWGNDQGDSYIFGPEWRAWLAPKFVAAAEAALERDRKNDG